MSSVPRTYDVLLVEDDPHDAHLVAEVFRTMELFRTFNSQVRLTVVGDGAEAIDYMHRRGPFASSNTPNLVLLDLKLVGMDGREVLREVKGDRQLQRVPVVVVSSSESPDDIAQCYELGANGYVLKPSTFDQYLDSIGTMARYWMVASRLPT